MSNFMKNARSWLGLGQDPYYDEYGDPPLDGEWDDDDVDEDLVDVQPAAAAPRRDRAAAAPQRRTSGGSTVRSVPSPGADIDDGDQDGHGNGGVRVISSATTGATEPDGLRGVVRPLPGVARPHVVNPKGFNDVQAVADTFKRNQPVILNLQNVDRDLSRRLIDFGSGLCYGLVGNMERVTDQVFLLTPHGAQVSDDDRRRIREGGLSGEDR